jgi:DNA-binding XRE family transcriptional regulator
VNLQSNSAIMGEAEQLFQQPSASSRDLDWRSPVPAEDSITRRIPLSGGGFAIVDADDYDRVSQFKWRRMPSSTTGKYYAARSYQHSKQQQLHRFILGVTDSSVQIDHRDRNGLNNTKANLRICNGSQNRGNTPKPNVKASSRFKGVYFNRQKNKYCASVAGKRLGSFDNEEDAARVYDAGAIEHYGEDFAYTNFPNIEGSAEEMAAKTKSGSVQVCRIKAARLALNWSMRDLSKESGVALASVCRAETGKEPTLATALKLAKALKYAVEELWEIDAAL